MKINFPWLLSRAGSPPLAFFFEPAPFTPNRMGGQPTPLSTRMENSLLKRRTRTYTRGTPGGTNRHTHSALMAPPRSGRLPGVLQCSQQGTPPPQEKNLRTPSSYGPPPTYKIAHLADEVIQDSYQSPWGTVSGDCKCSAWDLNPRLLVSTPSACDHGTRVLVFFLRSRGRWGRDRGA